MLNFFKPLSIFISKINEWPFKVFILICIYEIIFIIKNLRYKIKVYAYIDPKKNLKAETAYLDFKEYTPLPYYFLLKSFRFLNTKDLITNYEYVDLGSGFGRPVFIASQYNFTNNIGIEISEYMHKIALINKNKFKKNNISFINKNIFDYKFENKNTVFCMFDPFGKNSIIKLLNKLCIELKQKKIILIYFNPKHHLIIEDDKRFEIIYNYKLINSKGYIIYNKL